MQYFPSRIGNFLPKKNPQISSFLNSEHGHFPSLIKKPLFDRPSFLLLPPGPSAAVRRRRLAAGRGGRERRGAERRGGEGGEGEEKESRIEERERERASRVGGLAGASAWGRVRQCALLGMSSESGSVPSAPSIRSMRAALRAAKIDCSDCFELDELRARFHSALSLRAVGQVERLRLKANGAFKRASYELAIRLYTHAIAQADACLLYTSPSPRD